MAPFILQANHGNCEALLETLSHGRDMFREMCKYEFNEGKSKGGKDGGKKAILAFKEKPQIKTLLQVGCLDVCVP